MIGQRFECLVVVATSPHKHHRMILHCVCDCGGTTNIIVTRWGNTKRCKNCSKKTHGMSRTNIYKIWVGMLTRCYNPKVKIYKYYGGRGISVDERWRNFERFYADMGDRPPKHQLDRIDNNKGYSVENCRWATAKENNAANKGDLPDNMIGTKWGKWTVIKQVKHKQDHRYYECVCHCGHVGIKAGGELRRGRTTQCKNCKAIQHRGWRKRYLERKNEAKC